MKNGKYEIPEDAKPTTCKGCHQAMFWVQTKAGKMMPVDPDGTPHWSTCPKAKSFKR